MDDEYDSVWRTKRQRILDLLESPGIEGGVDLKTLMVEFEYEHKKYLLDDLERLAGALRREGRKLVMTPPTCLGCGFVFKQAARQFKIPSKCPKCRAERVAWPRVKLKK